MSDTKSLLGPPRSTEGNSVPYVHSISEAGRLLPSASRWNSIEIDFGLNPQRAQHDDTPSKFSKSFDCNLVVADKHSVMRFVGIFVSLAVIVLAISLVLKFLPHKHSHHDSPRDLQAALSKALMFFDAQKSGSLPRSNAVDFRGDSALKDGNSSETHANLTGGFYDSGNNVKFGFPAAYTVTLLSWSVIEYNQKFEAIGELDHVMDIIKWGSDYLLKVFVPPNSTSDPGKLYSQVGSTDTSTETENDLNCWQRPEDMTYSRPASVCGSSASDLASETMAALAAASLVFRHDRTYSLKLVQAAEKLFDFGSRAQTPGMYTMSNECGGEARKFYNSSGYIDELAWGGTWLFFATGNWTYLQYAVRNFQKAVEAEGEEDKGVLDWNSKLAANMVLFSRLRYFKDPGYLYEETLKSSSNMTKMLMCSYLHIHDSFNMTPGGLILLRPDNKAPLQYAATAAFLAKLYIDYLHLMQRYGESCSSTESFYSHMLQGFSMSQVEYILGNNPLKLSYLVGFGEKFPTHVHHRAASIPNDGRHPTCQAGKRWLFSKDHNPNVLVGAMVAGPDKEDRFSDNREAPEFTEPTISGNAGLVAALVSLLEPPPGSGLFHGGIDQSGIFTNIHPAPSGGSPP